MDLETLLNGIQNDHEFIKSYDAYSNISSMRNVDQQKVLMASHWINEYIKL